MLKLRIFGIALALAVLIAAGAAFFRLDQRLDMELEWVRQVAAILEPGSGTSPLLGPEVETRGVLLGDHRSPCINTVYNLTVSAGESVWSVISDHVQRRHPDMTRSQHEREVFDLVKFMQSQVDLDPAQTVRDIAVVPVGYTFFMTADGGLFLPKV